MFPIGLDTWPTILGIYVGLLACLAIALLVTLVSRGPTLASRILTALVVALVGGFAGCTGLTVRIWAEDTVIKPRLIESFELAFALSFLISLAIGVVLHIHLERWAQQQFPSRPSRQAPG